MKKSWQVTAITLGMSVALVSASFAAKALTDDEMDKATAKGQSAVLKNPVDGQGGGDQTIVDSSQASVTLHDNAQSELTAGTAANVAGENNVATAVNASKVVIGDVSQNNEIVQDKSATLVEDHSQLNKISTVSEGSQQSHVAQGATLNSTTTAASESQESSSSTSAQDASGSFGKTIVVNITASRHLAYSEAFPANVSVALTGAIGATADAKANASATGTGSAQSTASTATQTTQLAQKSSETASLADNSANASATTPIDRQPSEQQISANITKNTDVSQSDAQTYQTVATGEAAISKAVTQGDQQAYAVGAAKNETVVEVRLPVARTVTADESLSTSGSSLNENGSFVASAREASQSGSSGKSSSSTVVSQSETLTADAEGSGKTTSDVNLTQLSIEHISADHVVLNAGNQSITDNTIYTVELGGNAEQDAVALNIFNVAGRNNVAAAWNMATSENDLTNVGGALTQVNTIKQTN